MQLLRHQCQFQRKKSTKSKLMQKWWTWTLCSSQAGNPTRLTPAVKYTHRSPLYKKCVRVVGRSTGCTNRLRISLLHSFLESTLASKKCMLKITITGWILSKAASSSNSRTRISNNSKVTSLTIIQKAVTWVIVMAVKSLVHGMSRMGVSLWNHLTVIQVKKCLRNVSDALLTKSIEDSYVFVVRPMALKAALTSTRRTKVITRMPWSKAKKQCLTMALVPSMTATVWANSTPLCTSITNKRITMKERMEAVRLRRLAMLTSGLITQIQHILLW